MNINRYKFSGINFLTALLVPSFAMPVWSQTETDNCPLKPIQWPRMTTKQNTKTFGEVHTRMHPSFSFEEGFSRNGAPMITIKEQGVLSFLSPVDDITVRKIRENIQKSFNESCERSLDGMNAWKSSDVPLSYSIKITATARSCVKVNYPCFEKGICSSDLIQDLQSGQVDSKFSVALKIKDEKEIELAPVNQGTSFSTSGGDFSKLLTDSGIMSVLQSLKIVPPINEMIETGNFLLLFNTTDSITLARPTVLYLPKLIDVQWIMANGDDERPFAIKYTREDKKPRKTGCRLAACISTSTDIHKVGECLLKE